MDEKQHKLQLRPHAVCVPFPAQGHINPMLQLAKLLHYRGFHITFVNTEFNHKRLLRSGGMDSVSGLPSFRFYTIPDGLPPSDLDATQDVPSLCDSTPKNCLAPFKDLLFNLNNRTPSSWSDDKYEVVPPVSCIVSDLMMSFTLDVAEEIGVPEVVLLWTASLGSLLVYSQIRHLIKMGHLPLKDINDKKNGYMDTVVNWIPGMKGARLKDLPANLRVSDTNDIMLTFPMIQVERAGNASAIIVNSFRELEHDALEPLSALLPPIYTLGPLHLLFDRVPDKTLRVLSSSLWKEDQGCVEWLDSKQPNSVVYVNFGSITVMTSEKLMEFAWGLANSKQNFLWTIRPDLVTGESANFPPDFVEETKERAFLTDWCPQQQVLRHPSVGAFLTHSGWNSTIESISAGVQMICWPFYFDQNTNCWYARARWGIGVEMDGEVRREQVERLVVELLVKEKGKEMKKKAMEWKKIAEGVAGPSGSSHSNLDKLINQVLVSKKSNWFE